jgi:membrane fusion protein, heavy metal efflux system
MIHALQFPNDRRLVLSKLTLVAALLVASAACGPSTGKDAHADHEHDHSTAGHAHDEHADEHTDDHADEQLEPKTDAHHVAESRSECEDDVVLPPGALERYGIEVAPAQALQLTPTVSAPGHLSFPQGAVARIGSAVVGRVVELRVRSSAKVARGDVLLVVASPELGAAQSEYLQQRTLASSAGPTLELARSSFERAKELRERVEGISLTEVQRRESELRQAERDLEIARGAQAAALNRLLLFGMDEPAIAELERTGKIDPHTTVRAPLDGIIVDLAVTLGELVGPEKDRLLVIGDPSVLWAIAEVSEAHLAEVAVGAAARVAVPALPQGARTGRVAAVSAVLEPLTRTAEVRVEVPNPDGTLLPGMFIQVEIDSSRGAGTPQLAVPDGAVLTIAGRPAVFVPLEPGGSTFCMHAIEIGAPIGDYIPVLAGLQAGELVVVSGAFRLKAEHGKASAQHEH